MHDHCQSIRQRRVDPSRRRDRSFQVTSPSASKTFLVVKARAKKKLKLGKRAKLVKSATTNARITRVNTTCHLDGTKLKGENKRAACKVTVRRTRATYSNINVRVTPKRSVRLKIRTKIVANAPGMEKDVWNRTWKVKNKPRTHCALNGNS